MTETQLFQPKIEAKLVQGALGFRGNPRLYKPGVSFEWTQEMVDEYQRCVVDHEYFIRKYVRIVDPDRGLVAFEPYSYQLEMAEKACKNRFTICKLPRQSGKTTIVVGIILWHLLFERRYQIAIVSNKLSQARDTIMNRLRLAYEYLPPWLQQPIVTWNKTSIQLGNGSGVMCGATTTSAIRGSTFNLVYMDEFCHVHPNMQHEFWKSVLPTISKGKRTKIIITSTPRGLDLFYEIWMGSVRGENTYKRVECNWWDTPGRDEKWKGEMLSQMTQDEFDQEFNTEFLGSAGTLINGKVLAAMKVKNPIEVTDSPKIKVFAHPAEGHQYVCTVDVARGVRLDYSAFTVVDITTLPYEVVATYRNNEIPPIALADVVYNVCLKYNRAVALVESNDAGVSVVEGLLYHLEYDNVIMTTVKAKTGTRVGGGFAAAARFGVNTNKQVKKIGCTQLKMLIEKGQFEVWDPEVKLELSTFSSKKKKDSFEAEEGKHDDLVMTLVLFAWLTTQEYFKEENDKVDIKAAILQQQEELTLPFGFIADGQSETPLDPADGDEFEQQFRGWNPLDDWPTDKFH